MNMHNFVQKITKIRNRTRETPECAGTISSNLASIGWTMNR